MFLIVMVEITASSRRWRFRQTLAGLDRRFIDLIFLFHNDGGRVAIPLYESVNE